jgi:hypothetical protein
VLSCALAAIVAEKIARIISVILKNFIISWVMGFVIYKGYKSR